MNGDVERWADQAMFKASRATEPGTQVSGPKVTLLQMTPDPLGSIAAACRMYEGKPCHSLDEITEDERTRYFLNLRKTKIQAAFEFVDLHFLIENVTRAFTHQMVRQRTAVYVQESQRFAVKDNAAWEVTLPPSLSGLKDDDPRRVIWDGLVANMADGYNALVSGGIPAEDARGLLPTNITTKIHYKTNLRNLIEHAGMRLCTQAQFEWRVVWAQIVGAIRDASFGPDHGWEYGMRGWASEATGRPTRSGTSQRLVQGGVWRASDLADLFKPVCFNTGKCEFMADIDRHCSIRERVERFHEIGVKPEEWDKKEMGPDQIQPWEWLADPASARKRAEA